MHKPASEAHGKGRAEVIAAFCGLLDTGDEADRCYACRALGAIGATQAIPDLAERLRDEDIDVCVDAAGALGALGSQAVFAPLNESLRDDPDGEVKTAVLASLARNADPQTFPLLMEIAEHRPPEMAFDESADWDPWWDMQREAVLALGRTRVTEAAPMLARLLDDEDGQDIDAEIMMALARLGEAGERILLERIDHRREQVRRRAITALGRGGSSAGLEALARALEDNSPQVRSAALEALEERAGRGYLPAILRLYRDGDAGVRKTAIGVGSRLAAAGGAPAPDFPALRPLLADKDSRVRAAALSGMDREHLDAVSVGHVYKALQDRAPDVAAVACKLIGRHGSEEHFRGVLSIVEDATADPELRRVALRAVGTRGKWNETTASLIMKILAEPRSPVRLAAMDVLLDLHHAGAATETNTVGDAAQTPSPLDLIIAALAGDLVTRADSQAAAETPSGTVTDESLARENSIATGHASSSAEIRPAKSSLEAIAMDNAEIALALAGSEDTGIAPELVVDEETAEYLAITEANEATARWLFTRNALERDLDVRRLAARILGSTVAEPAVSALLEALACDDATLRRESAASLAALTERFPHSHALAVGLEALLDGAVADDRDVRIACLHVLGALPTARACDGIVAALDDKEPAVRIEAVRSLGRIAKNAFAAPTIDHAPFASHLPRALEKLADREPGVRIAAARTLTDMLCGRDCDLRDASVAVDALTRAAFAGTGDQAREMGRALRDIAPALATDHLLTQLRSLATSAERRVVIELLEEIHRLREHEHGDQSSTQHL
ncbi:MAG: HEAT repeat domain-containing protein [Gammaproteobacteria bacterium]|nr:HEAT repeat domain-containing protein [Gammaproteobacteria bacterium]